MTGWIGDFFRFWWASFYWNFRKTVFRLRGAHRDDCPCQFYGDSGHALDARCRAVVHWNEPSRFRRVCPLLTETKKGWRCGVDAERVKPFWGRAALSCTGLLLVLYLAGSAIVFAGLRLLHYETSYSAVVWPPRWKELRGSEEQLYATQAQRALEHGNFREAMFALEMVYEINPHNYRAGLELAGLEQASAQFTSSDQIYERLLRDLPARRLVTAQLWFRALIARAAFDKIKPLAAAMLREDEGARKFWLNALLFAAEQTGDGAFLATVTAQTQGLPFWCTEPLEVQQLLIAKKFEQAWPRLTRVRGDAATGYLPYFQADRLMRNGQPDRANTLLNDYGNLLPPDESSFLRVRIYRAKGWSPLLESEFENLLRYPLNAAMAEQFCSFLIANPDPKLLARYSDRFLESHVPLTNDTIGHYQATYLAAILANDAARAEKILAPITKFTASDAKVLRELGDMLKRGKPDPRLIRFLPLVPLPTEVVYVILSRQPIATRP